MERSWAVLRSQPRREQLATQAVSARGVEAYLPQIPALRSSPSRSLLFPGYLFAHVAAGSDDLLSIRSAPGVAYILPRAGAPCLLPDELVNAVRARESEVLCHPLDGAFVHGDRVRLRSGPFRLVEAMFDRSLNATGRVRILLDLVHGSISMQTDLSNLEAVRKQARLRGTRWRNVA